MPQPADGKGKRYDDGKTRFELIPFDALLVIAKVFTQGAEKYEPRNWERGMLFSRCLGSLMRHITAWQNGEDNDPESGLPHMGHAAWNCIALLTYGLRGIGEDDRPAKKRKNPTLADIEAALRHEFNDLADNLPKRPVDEQVAEQNREASRCNYKAIEVYDHGAYQRNKDGKLIPYPFNLKTLRTGSASAGRVEPAPVVGDYVRIKGRGNNHFRVVADLGHGAYRVTQIRPGLATAGAPETVHREQILP